MDDFDIERDIDPKILEIFKKTFDTPEKLAFLESFFKDIRDEVYRDKTLVAVPEKLILAERIYAQINDILKTCNAEYEIRTEKNLLAPNISITVFTGDFHVNILIDKFRFIINSVDEVDFRVCDIDNMGIDFVIYDAFIEIEDF